MDQMVDIMEELAQNIEALEDRQVVDLYVLASEIKGESDGVRKTAKSEISERGIEKMDGELGSITTVERESWYVADEESLFEVLELFDIPKTAVMSVDTSKVEEVLEEHGIDKEKAMEKKTTRYPRKTRFEMN
jgi:hypothetical protein